jgi:hypothetical protein
MEMEIRLDEQIHQRFREYCAFFHFSLPTTVRASALVSLTKGNIQKNIGAVQATVGDIKKDIKKVVKTS